MRPIQVKVSLVESLDKVHATVIQRPDSKDPNDTGVGLSNPAFRGEKVRRQSPGCGRRRQPRDLPNAQ
jgi:hypothetical protein